MLQYITHNNSLLNEKEGAEKAIKGGCRWVQLRMKETPDSKFISIGQEIGRICKDRGVTFIINDRVHLVDILEADGVHLGKNDMPLQDARKILGADKIIGATANTPEDAIKAIKDGADYLGVGPFRFTTTKERLSPILGLSGLKDLMTVIRKISGIPVVAIGGIMSDDIPEIMATGVTGIALSGTILNSKFPEKTTTKILNLISKWTN